MRTTEKSSGQQQWVSHANGDHMLRHACAGMTIYMYHGKQRGVDPKQLSRYACVLTTYTTMGMEAASKDDLKQSNSMSQSVDSDDEDGTAGFSGDYPNQPGATFDRLDIAYNRSYVTLTFA